MRIWLEGLASGVFPDNMLRKKDESMSLLLSLIGGQNFGGKRAQKRASVTRFDRTANSTILSKTVEKAIEINEKLSAKGSAFDAILNCMLGKRV